jgi:HEAT repeat protein
VLLIGVLFTACRVDTPSEGPARVAERLAELLHDVDPDIRRTAAQALGKLGEPSAVPALIEALSDHDAHVRRYAAWSLGAIGEAFAPTSSAGLLPLLSDADPRVAAAAAEAIGRIGASRAAIEALTNTLVHAEPQARLHAAAALRWLESPEAFGALVLAAHDEAGDVRQAAVSALGELGDTRAVPLLVELVVGDPDPGVRNEAAFRLAKIADVTAKPALQHAKADPRTARWAAWALDQLRE